MDETSIHQAPIPASQPQTSLSNPSPQPYKRNWLIVAFILVAVIIATVLGWYLYTKFNSQTAPNSDQTKKRTTVNAYGQAPVAGVDYQKGVVLFGLKSGQITAQGKPLATSETKFSEIDQKSLPISLNTIFTKYQVFSISNPLSNTKLDLNSYQISVPESTDILALMTELQKDQNVKFAEPSYYSVGFDFIPNDPFFSSKGSWKQKYDDLWNLKLINMPKAWEITKGNPSVIVGVIDSGVDNANPDLKDSVIEGWFLAPNAAGTENIIKHGFSGDCYSTHGTHVAGIIGAKGDDNFGMIGMAPNVKIMPFAVNPCPVYPPTKVYYSKGGYPVPLMDEMQLILHSIVSGVKIINFSRGGEGDSYVLNSIVSSLVNNQGMVFVTAAGNSHSSTKNLAPANNPDAIVVSAVDQTDKLAVYSNFGPTVTVAAPGGSIVTVGSNEDMNILSTSSKSDLLNQGLKSYVVDENHIRLSGTSQAAPHVAGLAALVKSLHPDWNNNQIRCAIILGAVQKEGTGFNEKYGYGRIDAYKTLSLKSVSEDCTPIAKITDPIINSGLDTTLPIIISGTAKAKDFDSYTLEYLPEKADINTGWIQIAQVQEAVENGGLGVWDASKLAEGNYQLKLTVKDQSGQQTVHEIPLYLYSLLKGGIILPEPDISPKSVPKSPEASPTTLPTDQDSSNCDFPSDIAIYPGAQATYPPRTVSCIWYQGFWKVSNTSFKEVVSYYRTQMVQNGWTLTRDIPPGIYYLNFSKGRRRVEVEIYYPSSNPLNIIVRGYDIDKADKIDPERLFHSGK